MDLQQIEITEAQLTKGNCILLIIMHCEQHLNLFF